MYKALDLFLFNDNSRDWNTEVFKLYDERNQDYKKSYFEQFAERDEKSKLKLKLIEYAGKYESEMYGGVIVTVDNKKITLDVNNGIKFFELDWWDNDTFVTDKDEKWREKLFVNFNFNENKIVGLTIYNVEFKKVY